MALKTSFWYHHDRKKYCQEDPEIQSKLTTRANTYLCILTIKTAEIINECVYGFLILFSSGNLHDDALSRNWKGILVSILFASVFQTKSRISPYRMHNFQFNSSKLSWFQGSISVAMSHLTCNKRSRKELVFGLLRGDKWKWLSAFLLFLNLLDSNVLFQFLSESFQGSQLRGKAVRLLMAFSSVLISVHIATKTEISHAHNADNSDHPLYSSRPKQQLRFSPRYLRQLHVDLLTYPRKIIHRLYYFIGMLGTNELEGVAWRDSCDTTLKHLLFALGKLPYFCVQRHWVGTGWGLIPSQASGHGVTLVRFSTAFILYVRCPNCQIAAPDHYICSEFAPRANGKWPNRICVTVLAIGAPRKRTGHVCWTSVLALPLRGILYFPVTCSSTDFNSSRPTSGKFSLSFKIHSKHFLVESPSWKLDSTTVASHLANWPNDAVREWQLLFLTLNCMLHAFETFCHHVEEMTPHT